MEVKCPKCRYKFDTSAALGMKELACVCPRCGLPFTYVIQDTDEVKVDIVDTSIDDNVGTINTSHIQQDDFSQFAPVEIPQNDASQGRSYTKMPITNTIRGNHELPPLSDPQYHQHKKKSGCAIGCFISFIVLLLLVVFCVRSCNKEHSYSSNDIDDDSFTAISKDKQDIADTIPAKDSFTEVHPDEIPSWVEGKWTVDTDYGKIIIRISNNNISETVDGLTSKGTFYYENGSLNCDYGDGNLILYKVNEDDHTIDAGDGMIMHKE